MQFISSRSLFAAGLIMVCSFGAAAAQDAGQEPQGTVLALSESAVRQVAEDLLVAMLESRAVASTASAAQAEVNEAMTQAMRTAQEVAGVEVETGQYSVYTERLGDESVERWVASQSMRLESRDGDAMLDLVGQLQGQGLAVQNLQWQLSDEERRLVERDLIGEALSALRDRAAAAATAMGMRVTGWKRVDVGGSPPVRPYAERSFAMAKDAAPPPVAIPGETEVQVQVSGEALMTAD